MYSNIIELATSLEVKLLPSSCFIVWKQDSATALSTHLTQKLVAKKICDKKIEEMIT